MRYTTKCGIIEIFLMIAAIPLGLALWYVFEVIPAHRRQGPPIKGQVYEVPYQMSKCRATGIGCPEVGRVGRGESRKPDAQEAEAPGEPDGSPDRRDKCAATGIGC